MLSDAVYLPILMAEFPTGSAFTVISDISYPNTETCELVLLPIITTITVYNS